jgi:hypothetical protein
MKDGVDRSSYSVLVIWLETRSVDVVLSGGRIVLLPGDIWQCLGDILVVTILGK